MKICPDCLERVGDDLEYCPRDGTRLREIHAREDDPMEGRVFDERWVVEKRIGGGGMGTVYRGHQLSVDRTVAIKILRSSLCEDDEHVERFFREANLASNIDDPRCVTIFDFGQDPEDRALYLAMELLEGESLQERIRRAKLSLRETLEVTIQVCEALETLHDQQIIHRDLKPENIFLIDEIGEGIFSKLLDFGLAKALDSDSTPVTKSGSVYGTPAFMSPEQCMGTEVDPRADLYALGCVLYLMISGRTPFAGDASVRTLMAHVNREPPPLDGPAAVPAELERAVMRLLAKEPADRYPSAERLRERLEGIRDGLAEDASFEVPIDTIPPPDAGEEGESVALSVAPTEEAGATERRDSAEPERTALPEESVDSSAETEVFAGGEGAVAAGSSDEAGVSKGGKRTDERGAREDSSPPSLAVAAVIVFGGALVVVVAMELRGSDAEKPTAGAEVAAATDVGRDGESSDASPGLESGDGEEPSARRAARRRGRDLALGVERRSAFAAAAVMADGDPESGRAGGVGGGTGGTEASARGAARSRTKGERRSERSEADARSSDTAADGAAAESPLLTRSAATRVFESKNDAVRRCLDGSLGPDAGREASVELQLRVDGDGRVSKIEVRKSNAADGDVECVTDLAGDWTFPPTATGQPARLVHRYRFRFRWDEME